MIIRSFISFVLGLIPAFPVDAFSGWAQAASWVVVTNYYIPWDTFLACAGSLFGVWLFCAVTSVILQLF